MRKLNAKNAPTPRGHVVPSASPLLIRQPVLFLDIDGVLNGHEFMAAALSCSINRPCVEALNYVVARANPKIVLSSAWRYMILGKAMSITGFEYLLRTHGVSGMAGRIIATTRADEVCSHCNFKHARGSQQVDHLGMHLCNACGRASTRGQQISAWLRANKVSVYAVVDDCDSGIAAAGHPFVRTDGSVGLTLSTARRLASLLLREPTAAQARRVARAPARRRGLKSS